MNITELVKAAYDNAVKKGFYDCPECRGTGYEFQDMGKKYNGDKCLECNGTGINQNKNIGELLMLVVSELSEALEAHRKCKTSNGLLEIYEKESANPCVIDCSAIFEHLIKNSLEDELADAVIRIADMCGYLGIDLEKHIELKMKYNATREYKHGKRY